MNYTIDKQTIRLASYNCNSIMHPESQYVLHELCKTSDVICLQETMLPKQELDYLSYFHPDFYGRGVSPTDLSAGMPEGRPQGGLGILWRKDLPVDWKILIYNNEYRVMGISLKFLDKASCHRGS